MTNSRLIPGTIDYARHKLFESGRFLKGNECPCCNQFVKLYRRNMTSTVALSLILIYKHWKVFRYKHERFFHVPDYFDSLPRQSYKCATEFSKLVWWGLIEKMPEGLREDGSNRVGKYRITPKGIKFVESEVTVLKYAYIYNNDLRGLGGNEITIGEALGTKFSYIKLMAGNPAQGAFFE